MAADLRLFKDKACSQEIAEDTLTRYVTILGMSDGSPLDGNGGDTKSTVIYIKNVGTRAAMHVLVVNAQDTKGYISIKSPNSKDTDDGTLLGDIRIDEVIPVTFTVSVPRYTEAVTYTVALYLDYYTLPDKEDTYYNPYFKDNCQYCDITTTSAYYVSMNNDNDTGNNTVNMSITGTKGTEVIDV